MTIGTSPVPEFDIYADNYDDALNKGLSCSGESKDFFARERVRWLCQRARDLQIIPKKVLDFGCGTGSATQHLFDILPVETLVGVDVSSESLHFARVVHGGPNRQFIATAEYEPDGAMDLVFCNGVFHHIPEPQRAAALELIARSLRPGGIFAFWENNPWNLGTRYIMSKIPFDRDAKMLWPSYARRLCERSGLIPCRTDFVFIFPRFLRSLRRLEPYLARWPIGAQYLILCRKELAPARDHRG